MAQPPGAPPEQWERRKPDDGRHLALVAGLDDVTKELRALDVREAKNTDRHELEMKEHYVSYRTFLLMLAGLLGLNLAAMGWYGSQVEKVATTIRQESTDARRDQSAWRDAWDKRLEWVLKKIDGSSHFADEPPKKGRK